MEIFVKEMTNPPGKNEKPGVAKNHWINDIKSF